MMFKNFPFFKSKKVASFDHLVEKVKKGYIPEHIAIIMDGNGRWAKRRAMPRIAGHHEGMQVVKENHKICKQT